MRNAWIFLLLFSPTLLHTTSSIAQVWSPVGTGCSSTVYTLEPFNGQLFAGGTFTQAGGVPYTAYLAGWNGSTWGSIGNFSYYIASDGLYATDTALFMCTAGRARWWNSATWNTIPGVFNSDINELVHYNDELYAGGAFTTQAGVTYNHMARWNGTQWDTLTSGCNGWVVDIFPYDGQLFVGGNFQISGDTLTNHTALWNGTEWNRMGAGVNDDVFEHCFFQDTLYICGRFTQANGAPASRVAKWNGTQWVAVGGTLNDYVITMEVYRDQLYIGGAFTTPSHFAKLSGNTWVAVGGGCNDGVRALEVYNDTLLVGGFFTQAGGLPFDHIARWYMPPAPVADFALANTSICAGDCIQPTDLSSEVTTWSWSFPGGAPPTSSAPAPDVCYTVAGTYPVSLTVSNATGSSTMSSEVTVEVCAGVPEPQMQNALQVTPNPSTGIFVLRSRNSNALGAVSILDALGQLVWQGTVPASSMQVDGSAWPPGLYFVRSGFDVVRMMKVDR